MKWRFCDNDTVALAALGVVCLYAVFMGMESLCSAAVGAIGGYLGCKVNGKTK